MPKQSKALTQRFILIAGLCLISSLGARAQVSTPDVNPPDPTARGFYPGGSYSLSDIETVDNVSGNMMLHFPIAKLPPGRGGSSFALNLVYNSAIYDQNSTQVIPSGGQAGSGVLQTTYAMSVVGGWKYAYEYLLGWDYRPTPSPSSGQTCTTGSPLWYDYKAYIVMPDGSRRNLRLEGYNDYPWVQGGDSYYQISPFGDQTSACPGASVPVANPLVYITTDGSSIRVETNPVNKTWTMFLPDGTQVNGDSSSTITTMPGSVGPESGGFRTAHTQTITDRNGNNIVLGGQSCLNGAACTQTISDDLGRSIILSYGASIGNFQDTISWPAASTSNQRLTANVEYTSFYLPAQQYHCIASVVYDTPQNTNCRTGNMADMVVTNIELPAAQSGGPWIDYAFDYCQNWIPGSEPWLPGAPSPSEPWCSYQSNGQTLPYQSIWGELHQMAASSTTDTNFPPASVNSLYTADYTYFFDTMAPYQDATHTITRGPGHTGNPIYQKILSYNEIRDGNITPLTETTGYCTVGGSTSSVYYDSSESCGSAGTVITHPDGTTSQYFYVVPWSNTPAEGLVYKSIDPDGTVTQTTWSQNPNQSAYVADIINSQPVNQYASSETRTLPDGKVSQKNYVVDANGNNTETGEFDFGSLATPYRKTFNSYAAAPVGNTNAYWNTASPPYLRAKSGTDVYCCNGSMAIASSTRYTYDNPLTTANLTQLAQQDSATSSWVYKYWAYGTYTIPNVSPARTISGIFAGTQDANGYTTQYTYGSDSLYPTQKVVACSTTLSASLTGVTCTRPEARTTNYAWPAYTDPNTGMSSHLHFLTSQTDADNNVTTTYTYDLLGRVTGKTQTGGGLTRTTATAYTETNAANLFVTTRQDQKTANDGALITTTYYDPLGRVRLTIDPAGNSVQKAYRYGALGSWMTYEMTSNPYASSSSNNTEQTMGWTLTTTLTHAFVSGGRQVAVAHYAGGNPPAPWGTNNTSTGTVTTSDYGSTTTVTDEAGNMHTNTMDGLDRLVSVTEPNSNVTNYAYDGLNNLTGVNMAGQTRSFVYSSLSRLLSAANPESGTIAYAYDPNGNVTQKTDAIGTVTTMAYDGLNRIKTKSYAAAAPAAATPGVTYLYDQDTKGTLYSVTTSTGNGTVYTHDKFARVTGSTQTTASTSYPFTYVYSLSDRLIEIGYPTGRTLNYALDSGDRVISVTGTKTGNTTYYTAAGQNIAYTAPGGLFSLPLGNGLTENYTWNDRLQETGIAASKAGTNLLTLNFYPCTGSAAACSNNNGNIQSQTIAAPGLNVTQSYTYDNLNRLIGASEGSSWSRAFGYDAYGNMWVSANSGVPEDPFTPTVSSNVNANNQLIIQNSSYDPAGNQKTIGGFANGYDAEDRQVTAAIGSTTTNYVYDGEGRRVQKVMGSLTTNYVYDAEGELAAEYAPSPATTGTQYLTVDHLGSTRLVTNGTGTVVNRYDYLPFGEEIFAGAGGRTTAQGYLSAADPFNPKFTGKLRDNETGLDFMEARYFSSAQGRFTIPDWSAKEEPVPYAKLEDPQSLNLYSYVRNNPLSKFDVDGHCSVGGFPDLSGPCPPPPPHPALITTTGQAVANAQSVPAAPAQSQPAQQQKASTSQRVQLAVAGAGNLVAALGKGVAAAGGIAGAPETGGVSLALTVYAGIGAAGNAVAAGAQIGAAISGNVSDVQAGNKVADTAAAVTTVSGAVTLASTGSVSKAANASAVEGLFTVGVTGGATGKLGTSTIEKVGNVVDAGQNVKQLVGGE